MPRGLGQVVAGSGAIDVPVRLGPSGDTGHATRSEAVFFAKIFGETSAPEVRHFACPFSKHSPLRYEQVMNVCTTRPGFPLVKRVLEHIRKVHSNKNRCERCRKQYLEQDKFDEHLRKNNCTKVEKTNLTYPELLTPEQEKIFLQEFDATCPEDKWRAYYRSLFPDASNHHSIDPYYDYTTLTHRLDPLAAGLTSQKRPASPSSKPEDSPQYKRHSITMSVTIPQAGSFITQRPDTSPPSQAGEGPQPQCRGRRASAKTPQTRSFITESSDASPPSQAEESPRSQRRGARVSVKMPHARSFTNRSVGSPYYPPLELIQQVHQDLTNIASQPSFFDCGYGSGDGEIPSVNQNQEIGTSKCVDDASQSINLNSSYGSSDGTIPSSSNPHTPFMSPPVPPKFGLGDSGIALSSNASVFIGPAAMQSQSEIAAQDVSNPIPEPRQYFCPANLDPNLPSNMIAPDQQTYYGFSPEGPLEPGLYVSFDHHDQKST